MADSSVPTEWFRPIREHLLGRLSDELRTWAAEGGSVTGVDLATIADELIAEAVRIGASDVHVTPYSDRVLIRIRVDGAMLDVLQLPVPSGHAVDPPFQSYGRAGHYPDLQAKRRQANPASSTVMRSISVLPVLLAWPVRIWPFVC